jgi:hypothetical protein
MRKFDLGRLCNFGGKMVLSFFTVSLLKGYKFCNLVVESECRVGDGRGGGAGGGDDGV